MTMAKAADNATDAVTDSGDMDTVAGDTGDMDTVAGDTGDMDTAGVAGYCTHVAGVGYRIRGVVGGFCHSHINVAQSTRKQPAELNRERRTAAAGRGGVGIVD